MEARQLCKGLHFCTPDETACAPSSHSGFAGVMPRGQKTKGPKKDRLDISRICFRYCVDHVYLTIFRLPNAIKCMILSGDPGDFVKTQRPEASKNLGEISIVIVIELFTGGGALANITCGGCETRLILTALPISEL